MLFSASSAMTLSVPEYNELNRAKLASKRKMSLGSAPLLNGNGIGGHKSPPPRRTSIAGWFLVFKWSGTYEEVN